MTDLIKKLEKMALPDDIKKLSNKQCKVLCGDIRRVIISTVMKNGGHLSSNLGTVELTLALHRVFNSPDDKIIWDVGHQSYTHKILTGRLDSFGTLRKVNGISGFSKPSESVHDIFISGHSSNSISVAVGMADAMKLNGDDEHKAIAVIGDGSFTGGLAYEGLNNGGKNDNLIVIMNHNDMSISKNVGAFAKFLTTARGNQTYLNTKKRVEEILNNTPVIGEPIKNLLVSSKSALKTLIYHTNMFEDLGYVYLGPINGHNLAELEEALVIAKRIKKPVLIHVNTVKGKGFRPAEKNPGAFHSIPSGGYKKENPLNATYESYSDYFGKELTKLAETNENICAVTAAMKYGTGLQHFAAKYPERFSDVGIAEAHAVTYCAAMAKAGKIPVFAVYSSFLQRAYDQLIHDAAIDNLHVILGIDRAGFVGEDGETHQGLYDIPMLKTIPNTSIYCPSNTEEMKLCLDTAVNCDKGIVAIRYPKGNDVFSEFNTNITDRYYHENCSCDTLVIGFGRIMNNIYSAKSDLECTDAKFDVLKLVKVFPLHDDVFFICQKYKKIVFFEESSRMGGIGEYLFSILAQHGFSGDYNIIAIDGFVKQASIDSCMKKYMLDSESIKEIMSNKI